MRRRALAIVLATSALLALASPAQADYKNTGPITCASPAYAFTFSRGAGVHTHAQSFAGTSRNVRYTSTGIVTKSWSNYVRILTSSWVTVTAINTAGSYAGCVR